MNRNVSICRLEYAKRKENNLKDYKKLSKITFDRQAAIYDDTPTMPVSKYPKLCYPFVLDKIKSYKPKALLDMGCGTGEISALLKKEDEGIIISGIDLSDEMIKIAKSKNVKQAEFIVGDCENLPYEDSQFDMVICIQSFHHYPNPDKAFEEANRVLKENGKFVVCDMYVANPVFRWIENNIFLRIFNMGDVHTYSKEEVVNLMKNAGFSKVSWKRIHKFMYLCVGKK